MSPDERAAQEARGNHGIKTSSKSLKTEGGRIAKLEESGDMQSQLQAAIKDLYVKNNIRTPGTVAVDTDSYNSSRDVVAAIKSNKLSKRDAITYVEQFKLVSAEKLDELTASAAFDLLVKDSEEEVMHEKILSAQMEKITPEDAPKPEGTLNTDKNMTHDLPDQALSISDVDIEKDKPAPEGTINPEKLMPNSVPNQSDVNSAKPEEKGPTPNKVGMSSTTNPAVTLSPSDQALSMSDVEIGKDKAKPMGSADPKKTMPTDSSDKAISMTDAKNEDAPEPTKALKVKADDVSMSEVKEMTPIQQVEKAIDLIADFKMIFENLEDKLNKKEDKKKPEKKEFPKDDKESPKDEKKDSPKEDKKDHENPFKGKDKDMPKDMDMPKDLGMPPMADKDKGLPPMMAYKTELVKDEKYPVDSYHVVSLNKVPVFSISARQAFQKEAEKELAVFTSEEYAKELTNELNKQGAKEIFKNVFGSLGVILAQADKLPEDKFDAPAPKMNAEPDALKDISNNDTKKQSYADMILEVAATTIAGLNGGTAQEFVDEFRDIFSDETKAKQFEGRLSEKIENKKKDTDTLHTPDIYSKDMPMSGKPEEVKAMASKLEQFKAILPELKAALLERDQMKAKLAEIDATNTLKARVTATIKIAEKKASFGLIDQDDTKQEALRLAKLSDAELEQEVKELENSVKIANKINKKQDSIKVEGSDSKIALGTINSALPSQMNEVVESKTFKWSKGIPNNR